MSKAKNTSEEMKKHPQYQMRLRKEIRVVPSKEWYQIKIADATPPIVDANALDEEQALLSKVRHNRLIDMFFGVRAYSLQSHFRATIPGIGELETDEVYIGVRNTGQQFVIPVRAKRKKDRISNWQIERDLALCRHTYPNLMPRPVVVQTITTDDGEVIVLFEFIAIGGEIKLNEQKHFRLVSADQMKANYLKKKALSQ